MAPRPGTERRHSRSRWPRDYKIVCSRLRDARAASGLSLREVADRLGTSHHFVAKSESGERRVDVVELIRFAKLYRRPLEYFTRGLG